MQASKATRVSLSAVPQAVPQQTGPALAVEVRQSALLLGWVLGGGGAVIALVSVLQGLA